VTTASSTGAETQKAPLKPAYLIIGTDGPKVETALQRLRARIIADSGTELNIDEFSASQHGAAQVVAAANTLAFLSGVRLVLVHGVDQWRKPDKDLIADYLKSPAPDACLALVGEKLPSGDVVRKAVSAIGDVLEYNAPKAADLPEWVAKQAARLGGHMESAAARRLVQRVGDDQHQLLREVEKLTTFRGRAHIRVEDVDLMATRTIEASVFDLIDAVANRQGPAIFSTLEELYAAGENPNGLLFRVLRQYQHLSKAVALREEGYSPGEIQAGLGLKSFPARKAEEQSRWYDTVKIGRALGILSEADARMKGKGDLPDRLEFELCLGRLMTV
jgi:DNA polymerase-3 subunit delta